MGGDRFFQKWPHVGEHTLIIIPETFVSNVLPPQPASHPVFPGDSPRIAGWSDSGSYGVSALPRDPVPMEAVCAFQEWSFCFSQFCGAPVHKPFWPLMSDVPGAPSPSARSPGEGTRRGAQNAPSQGQTSVMVTFQSVGMGLLISHNCPTSVTSSLSAGVGYAC